MIRHVSMLTGMSSALSVLDVIALDKIMPLVRTFMRDDPIESKHPYKVTCFLTTYLAKHASVREFREQFHYSR